MGLTDELYIKMNSRGKPLTVFEHFKAELEREIRALDEKNGQNTADRIVGKIDKSWTDLLWKYRSSGSSDADDNSGAPYGVMWEEVGIDPGLPFEEKVKLYHMQMLP